MAKRSTPSAPIWARPAPGTRRPKLTRDQIARAALAIADADGFDEVSMRRVADELGVGTMTLYYYVKTKDELLALMDDAIMGEVVLPAAQVPRGWRAGLTAIAHASRAAFLRHPWAMHALQVPRVGPNGLRHVEQSMAIVSDTPLDLRGKLYLVSIVDDYVFGAVLRARDGDALLEPPGGPSVAALFTAQLATGEYPELAAMIGDEDVGAVLARLARWTAEDARFDAGLQALLDGMALWMRTAPAAGRATAPGAVVSGPAAPARRRARRAPRARVRR